MYLAAEDEVRMDEEFIFFVQGLLAEKSIIKCITPEFLLVMSPTVVA